MNNTDTTPTISQNNTQTQNGYKKTAIGVIPADWEVMRLGETGKVVTGNTPSRNDLSLWNGDFCWATAKDFKEKYINDTVEKITEKGCNGARLLPKGAILITCIASIGNNAIAAVPLATNQQINSIIVSDDFNNEWLYYQLDFYKQNLELLASKTAVPLINKSEFEKLKLPIPPLPEQQKIAEILSTWDEAIANCKTIINTLKARNKGIAQQLLTGKKRLSGFGDNWEVKSLGEMGTFSKGKGLSKAELVKNGIPCIRYGEIYTKHHIKITAFHSYINKNTVLSSIKAQKGDLLFAGSGETLIDIGKCVAFVSNEIAYIGGDIIIFKQKESDSLFLSYLMNSDEIIKQKTSMGKGHSVVHIYPKDLITISVLIPNIKEQKAISQVLETANQELKSYETKLEALQLQKKGLMQQLLTGKIRVNVK